MRLNCLTDSVFSKEKTVTVNEFLIHVVLFAYLHDRNRTVMWSHHGSCTDSDHIRVFDLIDVEMIRLLLDGPIDMVPFVPLGPH